MPSPVVSEKRRRRLADVDRSKETGTLGAVVAASRSTRRSGGAGAQRTGPKPDGPVRQIKYLNRDIAGLYRKPDRAERVIDVQKNVYRDRVWRNHSIAFVVRTLRQRPGGNQVKGTSVRQQTVGNRAVIEAPLTGERVARVSISSLEAANFECRSNTSFKALLLTACVIVNRKLEWPSLGR